MQSLGKPAHALLQGRQPEQDEGEAGERGAGCGYAPAAQKLDQCPDEDHRQRRRSERDAHANERDEPAGAGRADVGAKDQP
jgi:hypothetical protein